MAEGTSPTIPADERARRCGEARRKRPAVGAGRHRQETDPAWFREMSSRPGRREERMAGVIGNTVVEPESAEKLEPCDGVNGVEIPESWAPRAWILNGVSTHRCPTDAHQVPPARNRRNGAFLRSAIEYEYEYEHLLDTWREADMPGVRRTPVEG